MPTGTIKFFNALKGFGFITADEGGKDIFLPLTTLAAAGLADLPLGQRVAFEMQPDKKGPKAINLVLTANAPSPSVEKPTSTPASRHAPTNGLTFYYDPSSEEALISLAALRATGRDHSLIDYMSSPPSRDKLIGMSLLLRESDQSLMRKYHPLFRELRLDDRFISQSELWDAIVEHPTLINGPILMNGSQARICRSEEDVAAFLEGRAPKKLQREAASTPLPKGRAKAAENVVAGPVATTTTAINPVGVKTKPAAKGPKAKEAPRTLKQKPKAKPAKSEAKVAKKVKAKPAAKAKSKAKPSAASKRKK